MTIAVEAVARERDGDAETKVASGRFTFVALDDGDRPREIGGAVPSPKPSDPQRTVSQTVRPDRSRKGERG